MKRLIAILLVALLCCPAAFAVEWAEGRSAAQPYEGVPEVDLSQTIGYAIRYPRDKMPASCFCDLLEIYLPREDIVRGKGKLVLHQGNEEIAVVDFEDEKSVTISPLSESMLNALRWGGGTRVSAKLPVSLKLNEEYYITMDEGCFRSVNGDIPSPAISGGEERWVPVFTSDFGVSGLYYSKALAQSEPEAPAAEETEEAAEDEDAEAQEEEEPATIDPLEIEVGDTILCMDAEPGDWITFDLVIGGDATVAVIFSDNGSVVFNETEYTESATLRGQVIGEELNWGIVFLDDNGVVLETVRLGE